MRAFTLIELLVVIAVVALVVGIILAPAKGARDSARDTACRSNLRQTGTMFAAYWTTTREYPLAWSDLFDLQDGIPNKAMVCPADRPAWNTPGACSYILLAEEGGPFVRVRPSIAAEFATKPIPVAWDRAAFHGWVNAGFMDGHAALGIRWGT
jgi:prepilin-type N-terminal cleavage/methylation domain-containing protein